LVRQRVQGCLSNLAETTRADEDYPVLFEMHDRWDLVPPAQRTQDNLRSIVQGGCNQRSALAAYWLGFFAPNPDPKKETAELQALENVTRTNTATCEMMEDVIALKSLALRSAETVDYWKRLAQRTPNVWERHQIVINAFGRWGGEFTPAALELLKSDPAQYVQWELLNGNLETRQGREYRNYWDIWIPANVLVVLEYDDAQGRPAMEQTDLDAMLDWLEAGARPRDQWVLNHMIYHLAEFTAGDDTCRLLRVFNMLPQRNQNWWILQMLRDPAALPLLKYWSTLPAPKDQQEMLNHTIGGLGSRSPSGGVSSGMCCEATEACLLQQVRRSAASAALADVEIHSEEEARKWLNSGAAPAGEVKIRYADELKRSAIVRRGGGTEEHWQYLYDCWRRTDQPKGATLAH
jgi:ribosomal protein S16